MDALTSLEVSIPASILQPFLAATNSSTLNTALENLIELARTADGRSDLASKNILNTALQLSKLLSYPSSGDTLVLTLKLIRNLCAGELRNQNSFIKQNGVDIVSKIISSKDIVNDSNYGIIRMGLQVLANVSLAGKKHQLVIWNHICSLEFFEIAKIRRKETCDPLLGYGEDWVKLILSRTCIEESYFTSIFSNLQSPTQNTNTFTQVQSFLLSILSEIINEQIEHITVSNLFAFEVFKILKTTLGIVNYVSRPKSGLPTGSIDIDALGYSLSILRDICAFDPLHKEGYVDIVDPLLSLGLIEMFLDLLRDLELPSIIRKTINRDENTSGKVCPYKGFRSDIVAVIGNCAYRRKRVQDEVREKNGILLMLQHCVTDDENSFLREWGIWGVRNLLEGNVENQGVVRELEIQGSVNLPELANMGLRVDVDQETRRAKLVNMG
ncbi:hypothetical protein L2E82_06118 [Cichorium intybus]|uniref:Uncharacterized protein n=1 Tax=Cichorium intybus TaxID=13427 RepID=A0ACB9H979_CICIN|nr:hypothetical protein L2E82_06118 [Cichorium intybus]